MRKWTARAVLVAMALVVIGCLPATLTFSLIRNWIADRPFSFWYAHLVEDVREVAGFFIANWRNPVSESPDGR